MNDLAILFSSSPEGALFWVLSVSLVLMGGLAAATPFLMPKGECFTVTVPDSASSDPYLRRLKRLFASAVIALTFVLFIACGCAFVLVGSRAFAGAYAAAALALCLLSYGLMLRFRSLVRRHKSAMGWTAKGQERVAFIADDSAPCAISMKWDLLMVAIAVLTAAIGAAVYPLMPERIALQIGPDGAVGSWADKSPAVAAIPVVYVLFVAGIMAFSHWSIVRSKKASSPSTPASTAWAYGLFARAQSLFLIVVGVLVSLVGPTMELAFAQIFTLQQLIIPILAVSLAVVVAAIVLAFVYGQNGSRLIARVQSDAPLSADDDRHWKGGVFYVNRSDSSLFVPERFGIGWTLNLGQPKAWGILVGLLAAIIAFLAACLTLAS